MIDIKLRFDSTRIAVIYKSGLLAVLDTSNGNMIKRLGLNYLACSMACALAYESSNLNVFGVVTSSGYLGLTYFNPDTGSPNLYSVQIIGYSITGIITEKGLSGMYIGLSTASNAPLLAKTLSPYSSNNLIILFHLLSKEQRVWTSTYSSL